MTEGRPSLLRILSHRQSKNENDEREEPLCLQDLPTPAFVVNRHAFASNCQRVLDFVRQQHEQQWKIRPHIKTHKTLEGVHIQACGTSSHSSSKVTGFVASTLPEVKLLVNYYTTNRTMNAGSILYGVPLSETKLPALWSLQQRLDEWATTPGTRSSVTKATTKTTTTGSRTIPIHLLLDHPLQIAMVERFCEQHAIVNPFSVFVKLDTGYHRAGTTCDAQGVALVDAILASAAVKLVGFYSHCGHAYDVNEQTELDKITQTDMATIQQFLLDLETHWNTNNNNPPPTEIFQNFTISVGSTPSLFHHSLESSSVPGWTEFMQRHGANLTWEIHPGNYTFYDRQQLYTKACPSVDNIAGRVLSRVIGHYDDEARPQTILMDAGATALTKETTPQGGMAAISGFDESKVDVYKMSQEVSMARPTVGSNTKLLETFPLGTMVALLPNHSCLAAACFDTYYVIDDPTCQFAPDTPIVEEWVPVKGW